jgi:hypothetical protein
MGGIRDAFLMTATPARPSLADVARRAGYLVIVCNADRDPSTELGYLTIVGFGDTIAARQAWPPAGHE